MEAETPAPAAIAVRLAFMLGRWRGRGWQRMRDGHSEEFLQTEEVRAHLGGELLSVEGRGTAAGEPDRLVHEAFALVWRDEGGAFWWDAHIRGGMTRTRLELLERGFAWTLDTGAGPLIRYSAVFGPGRWDEVGEVAVAGGRWTRIFEMGLDRVR